MEPRTVVVTGAGDSIGRAAAIAFAGRGDAVVVGARDRDAIAETVAACEDVGGVATGVRTDVRDEFDVERLAETAARFGDGAGIDVVVAAARTRHDDRGATPIDEESYAAFDDHWRTNARGVFATIREALPHLNDGARILVGTGGRDEAAPGAGSVAVSAAGAAAVARAFAADTAYPVGCVDPLADADGAADAPDPEAIGSVFVRAATELDPKALDGGIVDREDLERAAGGG